MPTTANLVKWQDTSNSVGFVKGDLRTYFNFIGFTQVLQRELYVLVQSLRVQSSQIKLYSTLMKILFLIKTSCHLINLTTTNHIFNRQQFNYFSLDIKA